MLCSSILIILSSFLSCFNVITMGDILGTQQLSSIVFFCTITQRWLSNILQGIYCEFDGVLLCFKESSNMNELNDEPATHTVRKVLFFTLP